MQSPHDTLFRFTFRHAAHTASWLGGVLPDAIDAAIDLSTLTLVDEWLPGLQLRPHLADLVFVASLRDGSGHVLILVEHKSHHDAGVGDQMLRYAVLLQNAFQQRHAQLPLVLAILLQHGRPTAAQQVPSNPPGLFARWQPSLRYLVDDLTRCDEGALRRPGLTPLTELTFLSLRFLPHLRPEQVPLAFDRWQDLLRAVDHADSPPLTPPLGRDAIDAIGWYALAVTDVTPEILSEAFGRNLHRPEETIMSTLERTYQKGKAEGEAKGRAETLLRMLHKRFGALSQQIETRVRNGSPAELDAWTDRILDATSIAEVLDGQQPD